MAATVLKQRLDGVGWMYTTVNFKTKEALKEAVRAHELVTVSFGGNELSGNELRDGMVSLKGPHYPAAHSWYAVAILKNGVVIAVK